MSVDAIVEQVNELTPAERAELLRRLGAVNAPAEIDPELARLLDERDAAYFADPTNVFTLDEVIARARKLI